MTKKFDSDSFFAYAKQAFEDYKKGLGFPPSGSEEDLADPARVTFNMLAHDLEHIRKDICLGKISREDVDAYLHSAFIFAFERRKPHPFIGAYANNQHMAKKHKPKQLTNLMEKYKKDGPAPYAGAMRKAVAKPNPEKMKDKYSPDGFQKLVIHTAKQRKLSDKWCDKLSDMASLWYFQRCNVEMTSDEVLNMVADLVDKIIKTNCLQEQPAPETPNDPFKDEPVEAAPKNACEVLENAENLFMAAKKDQQKAMEQYQKNFEANIAVNRECLKVLKDISTSLHSIRTTQLSNNALLKSIKSALVNSDAKLYNLENTSDSHLDAITTALLEIRDIMKSQSGLLNSQANSLDAIWDMAEDIRNNGDSLIHIMRNDVVPKFDKCCC